MQDRLQAVIDGIRPAIRGERPYIVSGDDVPSVKLNQNESPFDLPSELKRELADRFIGIPVNRYPKEQPWELRDRLAEALDLAPESLLISNGSNELTHTLCLMFVSPGTPVVLPRPMFALYESVVRMHEGHVVSIPPRSDLSFDVEALVATRRRNPAGLTIVTTPNNPTGLALSIDDLRAILDAAPGPVVVDEAYWEFNPNPPATTLLNRHPNLIIIRTFSKAMGLAGVRLGYLIAHPDLISEFLKARLPFMVDRFSEEIGHAVVSRPQLIADRIAMLQASLRELRDGLTEIRHVETLPSDANFLLFRTPEEPSKVLARLASEGVLVRSMKGYAELVSYLRVNAGTQSENKVFLEALKSALRQVS